MFRQASIVGLVMALALVGCGSSPSGGGTDAGGGTDGGGIADGGGSDAGGADAGVSDLERCQAASAALAAACPSDTTRSCMATAYGSFCDAHARPGLFADAIDCLTAMSDDSSGCRTFSDPSGAADCVDAVYAGISNAFIDPIVTRINALCTDNTVMPQRTEPPLHAMTAAQLTSLKSCLDSATDCTGATMCGRIAAGDLATCGG